MESLKCSRCNQDIENPSVNWVCEKCGLSFWDIYEKCQRDWKKVEIDKEFEI